MPLQNRVSPFGDIERAPWRGRVMGNRGCIHDDAGALGVRRWRHQNWVCCVTEFRGRQRDPMPPGRWTALFFWDEAVALSAGHRPCGECRYRDYHRFMDAWRKAGLPPEGPRHVDKYLHRHRVTPKRIQVRFEAHAGTLPDGTFCTDPADPGTPLLLWQGKAWPLDPLHGGYRVGRPVPKQVTVLTPRPMVEVMGAGYRPMIADLPNG
jgi:hypothetical protein